MNSAVRAADAYDRAVLRAAAALDNFERHGTPLPRLYPATLRNAQRHADTVVRELPGLIDLVADRLSSDSVKRWRSCAVLAARSGDITESVAMVRVLSPLLSPSTHTRAQRVAGTA